MITSQQVIFLNLQLNKILTILRQRLKFLTVEKEKRKEENTEEFSVYRDWR